MLLDHQLVVLRPVLFEGGENVPDLRRSHEHGQYLVIEVDRLDLVQDSGTDLLLLRRDLGRGQADDKRAHRKKKRRTERIVHGFSRGKDGLSFVAVTSSRRD